MAFQILIGGVDYTAYTNLEMIRVTNTTQLKSDTFDAQVILPAGGPARPKGGQEIIFLNGATREFAGIIQIVKDALVNPSQLAYTITARDYTVIFDHHLVVATYPQQLAGLMVRDIITNWANKSGYTFSTASVVDGYSVPEQIFDHIAPSDAIQAIASILEFGFYVDYNKVVHFFALEDFPSPLPGNLLDLDNDVANYHDAEFTEDVSQIKNRIILHGFKVKSQNPKAIALKGDGNADWFGLGYEPWSTDPADMSMTINGAPVALKVDNRDGQPGDGQTGTDKVFVCFDNLGVRFPSKPALGDNIAGSFFYATQPRAIVVEDPASQKELKTREGSDGIYEAYISDPGLTAPTLDTAHKRGEMLLLKYGWPVISLAFGSYLQGWRAGQSFRASSVYRMGGINALLFVQKVVKTIVRAGDGLDVLHYDITAADTPFLV